MAPKEQNPFSKFRMASDSLANVETEKLITHVPVGKPNKQKFVRVHPDQAFWFECAILKLEDTVLGSTHAITVGINSRKNNAASVFQVVDTV